MQGSIQGSLLLSIFEIISDLSGHADDNTLYSSHKRLEQVKHFFRGDYFLFTVLITIFQIVIKTVLRKLYCIELENVSRKAYKERDFLL